LKDDWHASLQLAYSTNTENASTQYRSGDQVFLNATLTKDVLDGWNIGPVAYFQQQVTDDENNGMFYGPDMPTFGTQRQLAFGGLVNHQFGRFNVTAFYTHEAIAEGTTKGNKFWLNFQTKLY